MKNRKYVTYLHIPNVKDILQIYDITMLSFTSKKYNEYYNKINTNILYFK